eukprot:6056897-Amphidinium_carterae.1
MNRPTPAHDHTQRGMFSELSRMGLLAISPTCNSLLNPIGSPTFPLLMLLLFAKARSSERMDCLAVHSECFSLQAAFVASKNLMSAFICALQTPPPPPPPWNYHMLQQLKSCVDAIEQHNVASS